MPLAKMVTHMLPIVQIEEFLTEAGLSPFGRWFDKLNAQAAAVVTVALTRLADGNKSTLKTIGEGASELRIDRGPGYRVYLAWDGEKLVILLGGGTKRRQSADIETALKHWRSYKSRKRTGR